MLNDRLSWLVLALLVATVGYFLHWGLAYTADSSMAIFLLATAFGLFMAFNIGGNDVANSFGTSVGAGTLSIKQALAVAAIFEVSGAVIAGGEVTDTIRKGIVDLSVITGEPTFDAIDFVYIMMAALFAAAGWLLIATRQGWPVSTTHAIIGGIVGASVTLGFSSLAGGDALRLVDWGKIGMIVVSWIVSPVLGGLFAYLLFYNIKRFVLQYNEEAEQKLEKIRALRHEHRERHRSAMEAMNELQQLAYTQAMARDAAQAHALNYETGSPAASPEAFESEYYRDLYQIEQHRENIQTHRALQTHVPFLAAMGSVVITAMLLFKGLKNVPLDLSQVQNLLIILMVAAGVWMTVFILARTMKGDSLDRSTFLLFSWMQVFTAAGFAFSHGSNDIANAIGPFAAVVDVLHSGAINPEAPVPTIAMLSFGIAMVAGLWFIGKEVITTVGTRLTRIHPASGFAAELSAAAVVLAASSIGIPVSSTHVLVGAVLGIGLVNRSADWQLMKPIGLAWLITLPAAATLAALTFLVLRSAF